MQEARERHEHDRNQRPVSESPAAAFEAPVREFVREESVVSDVTPRYEAPHKEAFVPVAEVPREEFRSRELESEPVAEAEPAHLEPMGQARPMVAPVERAFTPEPAPAPKPAVERPAQPAWKMEPVALPSDMVMIETQNKPQAAVYEDPAPRPARTPRQRPQQAVVADEPLQQVETGGRPSGSNDTA